MNIQYLHELCVLAEYMSFSEAAEHLYMSQSSLSKHLMMMEKELGCLLFSRTTRSLTLSKEGMLLLPYAKEITESYQNFLSDYRANAINAQNAIVLYAIPLMAQYGITDAIIGFRKRHPDITLFIEEIPSIEAMSQLSKKKCDMVFSPVIHMDTEHLDMIKFCPEHVIAIVPATHPLASGRTLDIRDLQGAPFLMYNEKTPLNRITEDAFQKAGVKPDVIYRGDRLENIVNLVSGGLGIAFTFRKLFSSFRNKKVKALELKPTLDASIYLSRLKNKPLSQPAAAFWQYISDCAAANKTGKKT